MKIPLTTIVANLRYAPLEGHIQIPDIILGSAVTPYTGQPVDVNFGTGGVEELIEVEEDDFFILKNGALCIGKESGFTFLTKKGFLKLRPKLKEVFERQQTLPWVFQPRGTWEDLEKRISIFHETVKSNTKKKLENLKKKAEELELKHKKYF